MIRTAPDGAFAQHQAEARGQRVPGPAPARRHAHRVHLALGQPVARDMQRPARDDEAQRRDREEVDHRQEQVQHGRHHRPQQAGDAVGGIEQAVDRLLAVAVLHQGRDGRLQRRREHHAQRRQADRRGDQQADRHAEDVEARHRQEGEGGTPGARADHRPIGPPAVEDHAAEQAGDQHGDVLHACDEADHVAGDLDRQPDAGDTEQVFADRRGAEARPHGQHRAVGQRPEGRQHQRTQTPPSLLP